MAGDHREFLDAALLALLIRAGGRILATPAGYVAGGIAGGALLYVIMMYGFAPLWNTAIVDFTPRVPFFSAICSSEQLSAAGYTCGSPVRGRLASPPGRNFE